MTKKKFDLAIMNPPYDKNLHLKILEKVIPVADEVINISPIRWLQDPFAENKKTTIQKFENIARKISSIEIVSGNESRKLFDIGIFSELGIYHFNKNEKDFDYKNFWKTSRSKNNLSILNKVCFNKIIKLSNVVEMSKNDGIRVMIADIAGNRGNLPIYKDFKYCIDGKVKDTPWYKAKNMGGYEKEDGTPIPKSIEFNTETEAENFYDSYKTTFLKYICNTSVQQQHIQLQVLPFMSDYSKPWTNKRFCDYFNITGFISDTEAEPGSEWEEILNTMEQYK